MTAWMDDAGFTSDTAVDWVKFMSGKRVQHGLKELRRKNEVYQKIEKCFAYDPNIRPPAQDLIELW